MNISTKLAHLDERLAVCAATLQDGEMLISVYASALPVESALYADLAQQRAVDLALNLHKNGGEAIRGLVFSAQPAPAISSGVALPVHKEALSAPIEASSVPASLIDQVAQSTQIIPTPDANLSDTFEESDVAPW